MKEDKDNKQNKKIDYRMKEYKIILELYKKILRIDKNYYRNKNKNNKDKKQN
jgi:hypothetical protein